MRNRCICLLLVIFFECFLLASCTNKDESISIKRSYSVTSTTIDKIDNCYSQINDIIKYNDNLFAYMIFAQDDEEDVRNVLVQLSLSGEIIEEIPLPANCDFGCPIDIGNDTVVMKTTDNCFLFMDLYSGELINSIPCRNDDYFINYAGDCYLIFRNGSIEKYNLDNELIGRVNCDSFSYFVGNHPYFVQDGKEYLVAYTDIGETYYSLNFSDESADLLFSLSDLNTYPDCYGEYLIDSQYEYKVNLKDMELVPLYSWNYSDIKPESGTVNRDSSYVFNDELYVEVYSYLDSRHEINIYTYDDSIDMTQRIPIVIGGYGINYDLAMRIAIYDYNTSQSTYRAYIDDYSDRFPWESGKEAEQRNLELIAYFESGNEPDIYYGNFFDYEYFAGNGKLLNLYSEILEYDVFSDMDENIVRLMVSGSDECYSVFSSYSLTGYFGLEENGCDISFYDLREYYLNTGNNPVSVMPSENLVDLFLGKTILHGDIYDEDNIFDILSFALDYGLDSEGTSYYWVDFYDVVNRQALLAESYVYSIDDVININRESGSSLTFVGHPTINGSLHTAIPYGQVAVSSNSEHTQECVKLITGLFEYDTQVVIGENYYLPVNMSALAYVVSQNEDATAGDINDLYEWIHSVDNVSRYDWGLWNIICEEVQSYYLYGKSEVEIEESLSSRLNIYINEY